MARVPVALTYVAAGISVVTFMVLIRHGAPNNHDPRLELYYVGEVVLWLCVALSLGVVRRASVAAWVGQVAAGVVAVAFVVVGLVKLHEGGSVQGGAWLGEAEVIGAAALAFGLAGGRVRTPAVRVVFVGLVISAVVCLFYFHFGSGLERDGWRYAAKATALLAASAAARMERFGLPASR